jgi:nascent polypeptide-associated complex subunit beta
MMLSSSPPAVQASIQANTYVISGPSQTKKLQELLPGILNQMGPDSLNHLKKMMQGQQRTTTMTMTSLT